MTDDVMLDHLSLEYVGPGVDQGHMDAYQVAQHIVAFSDFLSVISKSTYGESADIRTDVQGFRGESFDIDFVFQVAGTAATIFSATALTPKDMIDMIKQSFDAWVHLKGEPPKSVQHAEGKGQLLNVENNDGVVNQIHQNVYNVIVDPKAGEAAAKFVREPLETGISEVRVVSKNYDEMAIADKSQAKSFLPVSSERDLLDFENDTYLIIESPTFKEGNKWKFNDGGSSFYADMQDPEFKAQVDEGSIRFGKGDVLRVRLKVTQKGLLDSLRLERVITKVYEHRAAAQQGTLFTL